MLKGRRAALIFAAVGDPTRLSLVEQLSSGRSRSISELTNGTRLTRQAITKHLRVLEGVGMVRSIRRGRENLFEFNPKPVDEMKQYLASVSSSWDRKLERLRKFVEG